MNVASRNGVIAMNTPAQPWKLPFFEASAGRWLHIESGYRARGDHARALAAAEVRAGFEILIERVKAEGSL